MNVGNAETLMLNHRIALELIAAVEEQWLRCPACYGIGKVRSPGDTSANFCLVCEPVCRALKVGQRWRDLVTDDCYKRDDDPVAYTDVVYHDLLANTFKPLMLAGTHLAKRCPGCHGVKAVWSHGVVVGCLVCDRIWKAISHYNRKVMEPFVLPSIPPNPEIDPQLIAGWDRAVKAHAVQCVADKSREPND